MLHGCFSSVFFFPLLIPSAPVFVICSFTIFFFRVPLPSFIAVQSFCISKTPPPSPNRKFLSGLFSSSVPQLLHETAGIDSLTFPRFWINLYRIGGKWRVEDFFKGKSIVANGTWNHTWQFGVIVGFGPSSDYLFSVVTVVTCVQRSDF